MSSHNKTVVALSVIAVLFAIGVLQPKPSFAQSNGIESSIARLRRFLRIPDTSAARLHAREVPFGGDIRHAAEANEIDPALLAALVRVESNFDPRAVSHAGAQGLGQLMPATGAELGVTDPFDPHQNLAASARYLAEQLRTFQSTRLALAAYNAGPARVERGTVPASTWQYVKLVQRLASAYRERKIP